MIDPSMQEPSEREIELFNAALESPPAGRLAFISRACAGDAALRARVEALLVASGNAPPEFMERPASFHTTLRLSSVIAEKPGDRIGRYKLLQQIGEGGCGVVYMAEQEEPVRRRVALKVIKLGMDTREVIARFEAERQALAMMDHPNIARVLDAGATETGRPYFVMELVRGIKITDYCDQNNLPTLDRLQLFVQICRAIQHAHQKGIIHRDIKPSNILVTLHDGVPLPKVIDFGIAKATHGKLTDQTLFTAFEQFIGTPAYMSPEQAEMSALDIDTRSDIYSLGVLLYELLTGQTPFDPGQLLQAGLDALRRTIREQEPARPSTCLSTMVGADLTTTAKHRKIEPPGLIHLVRGDLDWIVMKALEKDRTRRYESASGLAADIERHLRNEPVAARPPSAAYRFRKMARRNRLLFVTGGAVLASLVLGLALSTYSFLQARKNLARAVAAEKTQSSLRTTAEASASESRRRLVRLQTEEGLRLIASGDYGGSLPFIAHAALLSQEDPDGGQMGQFRLQAALNQWPPLARMFFNTTEVGSAQFSMDGSKLLTFSRGILRTWDVMTGQSNSLSLTNFGAKLAALDPTGQRIAVAGPDDSVWVLDTATGQPVAPKISMEPHPSSYGAEFLEFSFDGRRLLTGRNVYGAQRVKGNRWGEARIWDIATGQPLTPRLMHENVIYGVRWSPKGDRVVTRSEDETGGLWDANTGRRVATMAIGGRMFGADFSSDGRRVALGGYVSNSASGGVRVWDAASGKPVTPLLKHIGQVSFVAFSPDGRRLVSAGWDRAARVWDAATGEPLTPFFLHDDNIVFACFSPDGRMVATASEDGTARLWNAATGKRLAVLPQGSTVTSAHFSPDGGLLATVGQDGFVRVWNLASMKSHPFEFHSRGPSFRRGVFSPDGKMLATQGNDAEVKVWDAVRGDCLLTLTNHVYYNRAAVFSPDSRTIAAADGVYDIKTGRRLATYPNGLFNVSFSPTGRQILLAEDNAYREDTLVIDAATGELLTKLRWPGGRQDIFCAAYSPDGRLIATGARDGDVRLWDAATGRTVGPPMSHRAFCLSVVFSPDSRTLATGGWGGAVRLWDVATAKERIPPLKHQVDSFCAAISFSPDGRRVATGGRDKTARVWDAETGRPLTAPLHHAFDVVAIAFSPDGRFLLTGTGPWITTPTGGSGGYNGEACLWDAATGLLAAPPFKCEHGVSGVTFSPEGRRILVTDTSATAWIWNLPTGGWPLADLAAMAQILSGQRLDATAGAEPLEVDALHTGFQALLAKYPGDFSLTPGAGQRWHEAQAAMAERENDWWAARFHLDKMMRERPDEPALRERRARAQAELDRSGFHLNSLDNARPSGD